MKQRPLIRIAIASVLMLSLGLAFATTTKPVKFYLDGSSATESDIEIQTVGVSASTCKVEGGDYYVKPGHNATARLSNNTRIAVRCNWKTVSNIQTKCYTIKPGISSYAFNVSNNRTGCQLHACDPGSTSCDYN